MGLTGRAGGEMKSRRAAIVVLLLLALAAAAVAAVGCGDEGEVTLTSAGESASALASYENDDYGIILAFDPAEYEYIEDPEMIGQEGSPLMEVSFYDLQDPHRLTAIIVRAWGKAKPGASLSEMKALWDEGVPEVDEYGTHLGRREIGEFQGAPCLVSTTWWKEDGLKWRGRCYEFLGPDHDFDVYYQALASEWAAQEESIETTLTRLTIAEIGGLAEPR